MPWDSDIDVQVSLSTMHFLAAYYNMTIHYFDSPSMPAGGRNYMLEINPGYVNSSTKDWMNTIDARWIDTETGVFIDITSVRPKNDEEGILIVKDKHTYEARLEPPVRMNGHCIVLTESVAQEKDLFPLRDSQFETKPVKIPYNYAWLLEEEYGRNSLTNTRFEGCVVLLTIVDVAYAFSGTNSILRVWSGLK